MISFTIFVVDDEQMVREGISGVLRKYYRVEAFSLLLNLVLVNGSKVNRTQPLDAIANTLQLLLDISCLVKQTFSFLFLF